MTDQTPNTTDPTFDLQLRLTVDDKGSPATTSEIETLVVRALTNAGLMREGKLTIAVREVEITDVTPLGEWDEEIATKCHVCGERTEGPRGELMRAGWDLGEEYDDGTCPLHNPDSPVREQPAPRFRFRFSGQKDVIWYSTTNGRKLKPRSGVLNTAVDAADWGEAKRTIRAEAEERTASHQKRDIEIWGTLYKIDPASGQVLETRTHQTL